jgi:hypothetical protein
MDSCLLIIDIQRNQTKFLNSNRIGIVQCGERENQAVLLEMPLVLPRSLLTPSVISGIFMKWYSLNQRMLVLLKRSAIAMIVSRLSSDGFLGWMKSHEALLHSLPLQVKFAQIFSGMTFGKTLDGLIDGFLR